MRWFAGAPWARALPWVAASLPLAFLVFWFWNRGPGLDADDYGLTLMHGEALAEGRPYGDTGHIPTRLDIAPPTQPPGLPLVAAAAIVVGDGFHWWTMKLAMALVALPFFLLAGLYFAREAGNAIGIAVMVVLTVALAAAQPHGATHVQSDLGFAALVWSVIYVLDRPGPTVTWPQVAAVFVLASMAISFRYLGVALLPTIALFGMVHWRRRGLRLAAPLAACGAGGMILLLSVDGWSFIAEQVFLSPRALIARTPGALTYYGRSAASAHLYPFTSNWANDAYHVISLMVAVVGLVAWSRARWRTGAFLFALTYTCVLTVALARSGRYLTPLYPLLIFGLLNGIGVIVRSTAHRWQERAPQLAAAFGYVVALAAVALMVSREPRRGGYLTELPEAQAVFTHLLAQEPAERTRVAFSQARVLSWATGIPAMVSVGWPPDDMLQEFERLRITHVVVDNLGLAPDRTVPTREAIADYSCRFERTLANGSFEVYRLLPACEDASRS